MVQLIHDLNGLIEQSEFCYLKNERNVFKFVICDNFPWTETQREHLYEEAEAKAERSWPGHFRKESSYLF